MFAASFLQIPLRSGHPCYWLMIRTATLIRDLHPIVITHARHTSSRKVAINSLPVLSHHRTYRSGIRRFVKIISSGVPSSSSNSYRILHILVFEDTHC